MLVNVWEGQFHFNPPDPRSDYDYSPETVTTTLDRPTGPDDVQVPVSQQGFTFAAGTIDPRQVLRPQHPPPSVHGAGSGTGGSWWTQLVNGDFLAEKFEAGLNLITAGASRQILPPARPGPPC